ncbi:MAG: M28 family peptidase [Flavobacteriaceae bacterium]|nr:M28 family peptidase [Flavobacteriaceae bacterium]
MSKKYTSPISFIIIIATIFWSIYSLMPKKNTLLDTPKTKFSTERALIHLKEISKKPHYVGAKNHVEVRNYIINELKKIGLTVEVQTQVSINQKWRAGANTKNILARIKGSEKGKALLLLSHYDSSPHSSLGASDAGSGVVTILEGIRAYLATNPKPKNDIIILISDAEELGLLGANAFVKHHSWAKNIGLVLNFEARGSGGPSYILMETNGGNQNLIKAFNKANVKYPVGNSLLYSIYKMLPNDTDLTIFREGGDIDGFNFAFLDNHFDYHTAQDSYERLDKNTLQHQAEYLMPLLYHFADTNLENLSSNKDFVFFDFLGFGLVNYPFSWILPLLILALILFIGLIFFGLKSKQLSIKKIFIGFIPIFSSLFLSGILAVYGWKLILKIYPKYLDILHGFTYNGHFYISAFIALTLGITLWIYSKYFKKYKTKNLFIAPIFIWLLINTLVVLYLPGAGFFIVPVFISLIVLAIILFTHENQSNKIILFSVLAIPILIIFTPLIQMFPVGLGLKMIGISTIFTVLLISLLIPIFSSYRNIKKLSKLFLFVGLLAFVSASFSSSYTKNRKQPNSILYIFDADKNEAYWASYNTEIDEFTQQFLGDDPTQGGLVNNISSSKYGSNFKLHKKTNLINLSQPIVEIIRDTIIENDREIHLKIIPQRKVNRLDLFSKHTLHFKSFVVNSEILKMKKGKKYIFTTKKRKNILSYYFSDNDNSLDLKFSIPKEEKLELEFLEASYDLYTHPKIKSIKEKITPRTEIMMPMPFVVNDAVVIKKKINL